MNKRTIIVVSLFAFLMIMPMVIGVNFLEQIFAPFKGVDVAQTYARYAPFIDAILYFWMFVALAQFALREKFKDAKGIAVVVGIILGIAMCIFEKTSGFNIGKLSWFAAIIFFLVLGMAIFNLIKQIWNNNVAAFAIAFLIMYSLINWAAPALIAWIKRVGWLETILSILFIVSIAGLIWSIISLVKGLKTGSFQMKDAERQEGNREKKWKGFFNKEKRAEQKFLNIDREMSNFSNKMSELEQIEKNFESKEKLDRQQQLQLLQQLEQALNGTWRLQGGIQQVYKHLADPAYDTYKNSLQEYSKQLDAYVNALKNIILKLDQSIKDSVRLEEEQVKNIVAELDKDINKLIVDDKSMLQVQNDLDQLKDLDEKAYANAQEKMKNVKIELEKAFGVDGVLKEEHKRIQQGVNKLSSLDKQDLGNLKKTLELTEKNNVQSLTFTYLSKQFSFNLIKAKSLEQIFSYVKKIKDNTNEKISINFEQLMQQYDVLIKQMLGMQKQSISTMQQEITQIINDAKKDYEQQEQQMAQIEQELKTIEANLSQTQDARTAESQVAALRQKMEQNIKDPKLRKILEEQIIGVSRQIETQRSAPKEKKNLGADLGKMEGKVEGAKGAEPPTK